VRQGEALCSFGQFESAEGVKDNRLIEQRRQALMVL
jgi:hypothetical protein